jgi:hypothetical protein
MSAWNLTEIQLFLVNYGGKDTSVSVSLKDSTGKDLYKVTNTAIDNDQAIITTNITGDIRGMFEVEGNQFIKNK